MSTVEDILRAARTLPESERAYLVRELASTLGDQEDDPADVEAAWDEELQRRHEEVVNGTARLVDADEVSRRIKARFGWK